MQMDAEHTARRAPAGAPQLLADCNLSRPVEARHCLVDDPDTGSIFLVFTFGEITPADKGYLHSPEVAWTYTTPSYSDGPGTTRRIRRGGEIEGEMKSREGQVIRHPH